MERAALVNRVVVAGLPLVFVVCSWFAAAGFPYFLDNNETFLSYVHARNLEIWNPWEYGWLTAHGTDPQSPTTEFIYSHNPNAPRYLHFLLLRLGFRELPSHVRYSTMPNGLHANNNNQINYPINLNSSFKDTC